MIATRVQYRVESDYVATNRANIEAVMTAARAAGADGMKYSAFELGEGRFLHLAVFRDAEAQDALTSLREFGAFQAGLRDNLVDPPEALEADFVGATFDWF